MDDLEPVTVQLPPDLAAFARTCAGQDDVSEVFAAALELLRTEIACRGIAPHDRQLAYRILAWPPLGEAFGLKALAASKHAQSPTPCLHNQH